MVFTLWSFYLIWAFGRFWMRLKELKLDDFGRLRMDGLKMERKIGQDKSKCVRSLTLLRRLNALL